jgi:hypothetical protein
MLLHLAYVVRLADLGSAFEAPTAGHRDTTSSLSPLVGASDARGGISGMGWALALAAQGPRYLSSCNQPKSGASSV